MLEKIDIIEICKLAKAAGTEIMKIYEQDFSVEYKEDKSPLTQADILANTIICDTLQKLYPNIPLMSEENKQTDYSIRKTWEYYWCIDPIDGTKEFVDKNGEFTINIALIHKDTPVLGVVYAPALGDLYYAKKGNGAFKNQKPIPYTHNSQPKQKLKVITSKSHLSSETQKYIDGLETNTIEQVSIGSSLKLCMIAEGSADIYPRMAPTMEWDTAAADAIVREAGKMSYQYDSDGNSKEPLIYNKENLLNPWFVVQ